MARSASTAEFGAFSVALAIFFLTQGFARTIYGQPQVLATGEMDDGDCPGDSWRGASGSAGVLALGFAVTLGVGAASMPHSVLRSMLFVVCASLPGLFVQDAWRYSMFSRQNPHRAALSDSGWLVLQVMLTVLALRLRPENLDLLVLAWGLSAWAGVPIRVLVRWSPAPHPVQWIRRHRRLSVVLAFEFLGQAAGTALIPLVVSSAGGLEDAGVLRGVQLLLAPVVLLATGLTFTTLPAAVRLREEPARLRALVSRQNLWLGLASGIAFLLWAFMPDPIGRELLGATWSESRAIVLPASIWTAAIGSFTCALIALRALTGGRYTLPLRLGSGLSALAGAFLGVRWDGASGVATVVALTSTLWTVAAWVITSRCTGTRRT